MVRRWGLLWGVLAAVLLVVVPMLLHPVLRTDVLSDSMLLLLVSWSPMLIGGILAWAMVRGFGAREQLARRIVQAMDGHPIVRELGWLVLFLVGFMVLMALLSMIFAPYEAQLDADLAMSESLVSRMLFLFTLPLLFMDRSGITLDGKGTAMPSLALKVTEPWRWLGMLPIAVSLTLIGYLLIPYLGLPGPSLGLLGYVLAFIVMSVCEEIFFRGMMQTRLEILMGRWGGIVVTSVVFAVTYALIQPYDAVSQLPGDDLVYNTGLALLTYATASLLYGYLWTCFRNTWIQVTMRVGMFLMLMPPTLRLSLD
ncbi:CPBP family intramembrane glutamic endopeptidase [Nocardiopsis halotolerans]|uniref:CPBP family intramembrane glutamic endopeptidase n=1 Tax=Nocardiopsis halotolerans TaxID=124252 RepID=UPI0009FD0991|nr:CPBP family intramembrane glutamic endopeptidase [Nocardiopsis halotolerans]